MAQSGVLQLLLQHQGEKATRHMAANGVLLHLFAIATDDVAPPGQHDRLGLVVDLLAPLGDGEWDEGSGIGEHEVSHQFVAALAHAENIAKPARFEFGDGLGADHAAIGDDADALNGKALAQPIDHRNEAADIGRVPWPHFCANWSTVAIEQHGQNHLIEVRPMVFGEAALSQRLAARSLEIEAGRVHEHEVERAEQIAPAREQLLLDDVLQAARREERGAVLLIFAQFLAQPSHRPIKVMQVEILDAIDCVILAPAVRQGRSFGNYRKDQIVFSQGDPADSVFFIQKGKVKVTVVSEHGKEAVVAILGANDFFGEACLAGRARRIATVAAMADSVIVRLEKATIIRVIHIEPAFAETFIAHLLHRTIRVEADLVDQLFNSSEKRLARLLLLLANFGKEGQAEPVIAKISQEMLAEMIGTTRARVSFFMNKFRQLGFIDYNGGIAVHRSLLNVVLHDQPQIKI